MGGIVNESFKINLRVMRALGFYPPRKLKILYKIYAFLIYGIGLVLTTGLGCLYLLIDENIDIVQIADNAFLLSEMCCYIIKFFPFINNGEKLQKCIHYFELPFSRISTLKQREIIENCNKTCRKISKIFLVFVTGSVTSWAAKPLFWKNYRLPVDIWLPFDPTENLLVYYSIYLFLVLGVAYCAYTSGAIDPLIAGLACHASAQIKILKNNLQFLNEFVAKDFNKDQDSSKNEALKARIMYNKIKECVDHHNAILEYVKFYEDSFSLSVFSQFLGSIFVICVTCWQLTLVDPLTFNFLSLAIYLSTMLSEIFLYCYYGAILIEESNSLTNAIYMGEWYEYDVKVKKSLIILMERAKKPMVVSAGKILDLSLATFTTILRRSYSLLAVLKNY